MDSEDIKQKKEMLPSIQRDVEQKSAYVENMKAYVQGLSAKPPGTLRPNSFPRQPQAQRAFATATETQAQHAEAQKLWQEHIKRRLVELAKPLPNAPKGKLYHRFFATGLGASMWFFVCYIPSFCGIWVGRTRFWGMMWLIILDS